jgi:hypothetical protein
MAVISTVDTGWFAGYVLAWALRNEWIYEGPLVWQSVAHTQAAAGWCTRQPVAPAGITEHPSALP